MKQLNKFPDQELLSAEGPFVTIYQSADPTQLAMDAEQIKFKNLIRKALDQVNDDKLRKQLEDIPNDKQFWAAGRSGVAFFITPNQTFFYEVSSKLQDFVSYGERPNILPLIEDFQYIENYHLLCLTNREMKLYAGRLDSIERIELPADAPTTLTIALGDELTRGKQLNVGGGAGNIHGVNDKNNELEIDQENYFRVVDKYVMENFSNPNQTPLILFALTENQAVFRNLSKNGCLRDERIESSPTSLTDNDIKKEVGELIANVLRNRHSEIIRRYEETTPQYKLGDQYQDLTTASLEGRIEVLFLEKDSKVTGTIDDEGQLGYEGNENFFNQLALNVTRTNGKVYVLNRSQMPGLKDVAAILRY
ncbi:baeRF6 domain-containing protein [Jeotgalibaca sp. A122]|uniref:baeRF6 domain-containing protein n=1 Tax=Jeotgalibaca sp. A122 TaxID=3457322 RepID=UPI003FD0433D